LPEPAYAQVSTTRLRNSENYLLGITDVAIRVPSARSYWPRYKSPRPRANILVNGFSRSFSSFSIRVYRID